MRGLNVIRSNPWRSLPAMVANTAGASTMRAASSNSRTLTRSSRFGSRCAMEVMAAAPLRKIRADSRPIERRDRRTPGLRHRLPEFGLNDCEEPLHAGRSKRTEAPARSATEADGTGAERHRLHEVAAATKSAVDEHGDPSTDHIDDLRQNLQRR